MGDQDEDGVYRRQKKRDGNGNILFDDKGEPIYENGSDYGNYYSGYGFEAGQKLEIEIRFTDEDYSLIKELICNYLADCLEPDSISKSNNYVQIINPFKMPVRDVLLFLKTEKTYMLTIFISNSGDRNDEYNKYLNQVDHLTETIFNDGRENLKKLQ